MKNKYGNKFANLFSSPNVYKRKRMKNTPNKIKVPEFLILTDSYDHSIVQLDMLVEEWLMEQNIKYKLSFEFEAKRTPAGPAVRRVTMITFENKNDVSLFLLRWL